MTLLTTLIITFAVLLATIGGIINERSGVLNLGIEGMMLIGALAGFAAITYLGVLFAALLVDHYFIYQLSI